MTAKTAKRCRVYWGTHGCTLPRGHDLDERPHRCPCCLHPFHDEQMPEHDGCVGSPPYYGPTTKFWGEDYRPETTS